MTMTNDEIRAAEYGEMAGELEELREWVKQLKAQAYIVWDCAVPDFTERQYGDHMNGENIAGCLRSLLRMIEDA